MSVRPSRDFFRDGAFGGATRGVLARITHTLRSRYAGLLHLARTYTDRFGRTLPDRRHNPTATQHEPRSNCDELVQDYVQLLGKYERLKESLADERVAKAEAQTALVDLEARHKVLEHENAQIYEELLKTRRNRDRLRDTNALLKTRLQNLKRLNGLIRDAYTQMATLYLDGVADGRLIKRAKKWLD